MPRQYSRSISTRIVSKLCVRLASEAGRKFACLCCASYILRHVKVTECHPNRNNMRQFKVQVRPRFVERDSGISCGRQLLPQTEWQSDWDRNRGPSSMVRVWGAREYPN